MLSRVLHKNLVKVRFDFKSLIMYITMDQNVMIDIRYWNLSVNSLLVHARSL